MANFRVSGTYKGLELSSGDIIKFLDYPTININEVSDDGTLADDSTTALCTEHAIKTYCDNISCSNPTEPPENPSMGDSFYYIAAGMPFFWDDNREMWLSSRFPLSFSYTGNCANQYLNAPNGYGNPDGAWRTICDLHICSVIIDVRFTAGGTNVTINPHINQVTTGDDFNISGSGGWQYYENYTLNVNVPKSDKLQVWCTSNKSLNDAYVTFGAAWRYIEP